MSEKKAYLFIDDSRVSRMKIRQIVQQNYPEWDLYEAAGGKEAHEMTLTIKPDLISIDINMPGMSGIEAISGLRQHCPAAKLVLLSGNIQDDMRAQAVQLGVGFVEKPITAMAMAQVIAYLE